MRYSAVEFVGEGSTMSEKLDINNNQDRLTLLKKLAELYTSSGHYSWNDIYVAMPKFEEDEEGIKFLKFFDFFQFWILIQRVDPTEEPEYFCALAKALVLGKDMHKLPIGNIPDMYQQYCQTTGEVGD